MGRIRTVKPDLFRHEELYDLEIESGFPIRTAFAGLFTACDREGRFKWQPKTLKLDCLPHDILDFSRVLDALMSRGFICKYTSNNEVFGFIPTWLKHQVINNKESASILPDPYEESSQITVVTRLSRVDDATDTRSDLFQGEGKGREGKGIGKGKDKVALIEINFYDVSLKVIEDFKLLRKTKKAPISQTAIDGIKREADKAGVSLEDAFSICCVKGWTGFEASWLLKDKNFVKPNSEFPHLGVHGNATAQNAKRWLDNQSDNEGEINEQ